MDVAGFFTKWLADVAADQSREGSVPFVVPDVLSQDGKFSGGSAAWADAATIIPWNVYLAYGDARLLERQYPSMKAWVEYMRREAGEKNLWTTGFHFGDWLAFATTASDYPGATTGKDLIATAFYAHSTDLLQRAAAVLGKKEEAAEYAALLPKIKEAFRKEFVTAAGRVGENTQTAYALALQFDLLPEEQRAGAAQRLATEVKTRGHLTTGFVGTPYLCDVLTRFGHLDVAYQLLNREEYPSWLYPVKQGATTIWERWDGQKPDGTFQDVGMNSFNHYAYGAIGEWMYRVVAGLELDPREPGYKHVLAQPRPGGGLTSAEARLQTLYGEAVSGWALADGKVTVVGHGAAQREGHRPPARRPTLAAVTEGGIGGRLGPGRDASGPGRRGRGGRGGLGPATASPTTPARPLGGRRRSDVDARPGAAPTSIERRSPWTTAAAAPRYGSGCSSTLRKWISPPSDCRPIGPGSTSATVAEFTIRPLIVSSSFVPSSTIS